MAGLPKALVACCDCGNRQVLVALVDRYGLKPVIATSTSDAISMLSSEVVCVAFCQDDLPGDGFKAVLKAAKRVAVPVIVSSRLADPERYLESMELGAFDFICLPYYSTVVAALTSALRHKFPPQTAKPCAFNVREAT
jgi:DNA-binding NtrC family response regulator